LSSRTGAGFCCEANRDEGIGTRHWAVCKSIVGSSSDRNDLRMLIYRSILPLIDQAQMVIDEIYPLRNKWLIRDCVSTVCLPETRLTTAVMAMPMATKPTPKYLRHHAAPAMGHKGLRSWMSLESVRLQAFFVSMRR
jgi:hypothetical protein